MCTLTLLTLRHISSALRPILTLNKHMSKVCMDTDELLEQTIFNHVRFDAISSVNWVHTCVARSLANDTDRFAQALLDGSELAMSVVRLLCLAVITAHSLVLNQV